jgi:biotin transporter BioY
MDTKSIVAIILAFIALALIVVLAIYVSKVGAALKKSDCTLADKLLNLIKAVVTVLAFLIGGAAVLTGFTGCSAQRSITVQGTVVKTSDPDSTRVIISSQETYRGRKQP